MWQIENILPEVYCRQLQPKDWENLEEFRFKNGMPLRMCYSNGEREVWPKLGPQGVADILQNACHHSAYAYLETIRQGYVTIEGGHRIGICGYGVTENSVVETIKSPSSLNIRVARQVVGCAGPLMPQMKDSLLIIGPPGSGKTTLLRDTVRQLSDVYRENVGLVDERGELSASINGVCQLDVGRRTDVLINVPKSTAIMMLLRTMRPDWIAVDEITDKKDIEAIEQASYCGVKLMATAHGFGVEDLKKRPLYRRLLEAGVFSVAAILNPDKSFVIQEVTW